jgi:hypothetical protein
VVVNREGKEIPVRGKVGDNLLYLCHRYDIEMEGMFGASLSSVLVAAPICKGMGGMVAIALLHCICLRNNCTEGVGIRPRSCDRECG